MAGFGRSEAARASHAARALTNAAGRQIIKVEKVSTTGPKNSITQRVSAKGGIDRNYYDGSGRQIKQISNHDHGHKKESAFGNHGEHAHDYRWGADGNLQRSTARELSSEERKENSDIL